MSKTTINLLQYQSTVADGYSVKRRLGVAATAVMAALDLHGTNFAKLLGELGPERLKEELGEEGVTKAGEIVTVFAEMKARLEKIYPTPTEGAGSGSTPSPVTGSDAGAGGGAASGSTAPTTKPDAGAASAAGNGGAAGGTGKKVKK